MAFQVRKAVREKIYVKIALMAPSGGGKTYSGLRLATGMVEELEKINGKPAKILMGNTESKRGLYYSNEYNYDIVDIEPPFNPEKFVELIDFAVAEGYDVLLLDSTTPEWSGKGGCLELQQQAGGTYQAWSKVTPRHEKFLQSISSSPIHIIATMRGKDAYETTKDEKTGRMNVQKIGVGAQQRDGFEYDFTCTFLIDQKTSTAESLKDNTHLFENEGPTLLTENHGKKIIQWANSGKEYTPVKREEEPLVNEDELKSIKAEIVELCKAAGGSKNTDLMETLAQFVPSKNPNAIKSIDVAKECLAAVKNIKPL